MPTLTAQIIHVIYDSNGFVILRLRAQGTIISDGESYDWQKTPRETEIVAKGAMMHPAMGVDYVFNGEFEQAKNYGLQLAFSDYNRQLPVNKKSVCDYLSQNCKGIGISVANQIYEVFGNNSIEILKTEPLRVASSVKHFSVENAISAAARLEDIEDNEALKLQLSSLLSGTTANKGHITALIKEYKSAAPDVVQHEPYRTMQVRGIGFKVADSIAVKNGVGLESVERVSACGGYIIGNWERNGGHTCILKSILIRNICDEVNLDKFLVTKHIDSQLELGVFVSVGDYVYRREMYNIEKDIAKMLALLAQAKVREVDAKVDGLEEDQAEFVNIAAKHPVVLLTGSPGTGKSHLIKHLCSTFKGFSVALAANTGKAARRMNEVTGANATTIHSLLCPIATSGATDDDIFFRFSYGKKNKLEIDVIIIDEASLIDVQLAHSLISAIRVGTRLIIVGDPNQLPSVGPGKFLVDLIASDIIPHVSLSKIKRQGLNSYIVKACHEIKNNKVPDIENIEGSDLFLWPSVGDEQTVLSTIDLFTKRISDKFGYSIDDIQIVTPNKAPELPISTFKINNAIQKIVNSGFEIEASEKLLEKKFRMILRINDRVINTRNCKAHLVEDINDLMTMREVSIVNGDIGVISGLIWRAAYYSQEKLFELSEGSRHEILNAKPKDLNFVVEFPQMTVAVPIRKNFLDLAYAVTCHKFQGSECPVVIVPLPRGSNQLLCQSWVYTALSRGKSLVIVVGPRDSFTFACLTPNRSRDSYLSYFIRDEMKKLSERVEVEKVADDLGWQASEEEFLF